MNQAALSALRYRYGTARLWSYALSAVGVGVVVAGFWNYDLVDGFGRDIVAGGTIGDTSSLAGTFGQRGLGFGFLFGAIAGVAATFTACNCVVFAMLPGLACAPRQHSRVNNPWWALSAFVGAVLLVSLVYGLFVGSLTPDQVQTFNAREFRLAQARLVFTGIGLLMLTWGLAELGALDHLSDRVAGRARSVLGTPVVKASGLGLMVGLFAVGRPFPVFRDFLSYAAHAGSPLYGAGVMMMQGLGQILLMTILFVGLVGLGRRRLSTWVVSRPHQGKIVGALALLAGGAFFVFYWGLAFAFDLGRWGFKLGWYG